MTTAGEWSGKVGDVWAAEWRRTDRSFADLSRHLDAAILAAAPASGSAIDIGCGAGATSIALTTARPDLDVVGIDIAPDLIAAAQDRAAQIPNLRFVNADLNSALTDMPPAALLFSRHGVMFFDDPAAVFGALRRRAAPGAALIFSCFQSAARNPWASDLVAAVTGDAPRPAADYAPGPFGFADRNWVSAMLARAGWGDVTAEPVEYRYVAGRGADPVADAVDFLRRIGPIARSLREAASVERAAMLDTLRGILHTHLDKGEIAFPAAAWIWRARATGETI